MIWEKLRNVFDLRTKGATSYPDFYRSYLHRYVKFDPKTPISLQSFVVLDTETTGLDIKHDNILSIGAVRIVNNSINIADTLSIVVQNEQTQSHEAVTIHGLVQTTQKGKTPFEALIAIFEFIGSDIIVGHHIDFDITMINKLSRTYGGSNLQNRTLDTSYLAKRLDHPSDHHNLDKKNYTLDKLCERFKIIPKARHTADGDAYITAILFMKISQQLHLRGVNSLKSLFK